MTSDQDRERQIVDLEVGKNEEQGASEDQETVGGQVNDLEKLKEQMVQCEAEAKKYHQLYLRTLADMENMRKRAIRDREEYLKYASLPLVKPLLTVIDDLERAIKMARETEDLDTLAQGVAMIAKNLKEVINKEGVEPIECLGRPFDPQYHEPLTVEASEEHPENTIIEEMQKGYTMKGRLIRPSLVKVSK